jgi:hypothetical protein
MKQKIKSICILFITGTLFSSFSPAQTVVPAGLGPMSSTQPDRETAVLSGNLLRTGGQNPTVKIVWGDEDGEVAGKSWDNTVVISTNQEVGSFSTIITIPNQEKIYYFRSVAENTGGIVVSRSLGVLNPSAPVGVANLEGRWSFDSENANDSSGTGRHGTAKKLFSPSEVSNMKLWLDAADSSTITHSSNAVSQWSDKSGNNKHATQSTADNKPTLTSSVLNGKSVISFDGSNDYLTASALNISQPYSIFVVAKTTGGSGRDYIFDGVTNDSHRSMVALNKSGTVQIQASIGVWSNSNISTPAGYFTFSSIYNGTNGLVGINGTTVSSFNTGSRNLSNGLRIGANWTANGDFLGGDIAELLIVDAALNTSDRQSIEGYLAHKWGLTGSLPSSHPHKLGAPTASSGTPAYITDTPFGSGKAIDLADGHVEISTGGNEDVFDGNGSFSVSAWVKGWPGEFPESIVSKGYAIPKLDTSPNLKIWMDADDANSFQLSGSNITKWYNKAGNGYIFDQKTGDPTRTVVNGKNVVNFDGNDQLWTNDVFLASNFTILSVSRWTGGGNGRLIASKDRNWLFGYNSSRNDRFYFEGWVRRGGSADTNWNLHAATMNSSDQANTWTNFVQTTTNGNGAHNSNYAPSKLSFGAYDTLVQPSKGEIRELLVFDTVISTSDRQKLEGYLAHKWGLTDQMPSGHPAKLSGWSVGRNVLENNDLSVNIAGIGGSKTASHSTALSTDNQWHHIVSTYDGGTRKIYLDGTEVSSASASGAVASTTATLLLGASDMNATAGTVAAARHSGIKLDEVRFYTSGLSSTQVSALYNFGKGDIGNIGEFATLPAKISGTTGTALSTTVTAAFPNAYYEAVNLTPGLGINSATGEISGTPTVGGVGSITVIARNAAGKRAVTTIPYDSNPSGPAFSFPTLSPGSDHALIMGEITHSGGEENTVDLFWGDNDGNQTVGNWDSNATQLGAGKEGFYGTTISGLSAGGTYYYRIRSEGRLNPKGISGANLKLWLDAADSATISKETNNKIYKWGDKSGNGYHATQSTESRKPTYSASDSLLNNKPTIFSSSHSGQIGLELPSSTLQEIFIIAYYDDGTDTTFDGYNTLITGPSTKGRYNIMGRKDTDDWYNGSKRFITGGSFKNAGSASYAVLPMPATLLRFTSTTARTEARGILYNTYYTSDGGWIGGVGEIIGLSSISSTSDRQKIEGYLAHKWGLTNNLPGAHSYKTIPPLSQTTWSSVQSFTTPTNVTAPILGSLATANVSTTSADLEASLTDNGNAATSFVFYWGDNDGVNNPASWDSNFSIANAQQGTLRKSLTGLTGGTTYYFRAYASNWKGNVWAGTTRSFTTVTSTVRDNPVRHSDLKGWWKLDGDLKDSSGNNHHGDADFTFKPNDLNNLQLWMDAGDSATITKDGSNKISQWSDKSGNGYHATQSTESRKPTYSASDSLLNNKPTIFSSSHSGQIGLELPSSTLQEIFIIAYYDDGTDTTFDGYNTLITGPSTKGRYNIMGRKDTDDWYNGSKRFITGGSFKNAGSASYAVLPMPATLLRFTSSTPITEARGLLYNAHYTSDGGWKGGVGEIIGFSSISSTSDRQKVEGYLAHKWGLTSNLPADHPFKSSRPITSNPFSSDVASGTGQSLDLSNGAFATVSTGGTEDVFDGDSNFSISIWVKGWPTEANQTLITKTGWSIGRGPSGSDDLTLNLLGAGGQFTQAVPMNDDNWHHLATTFGGGTKKIFVDGEQVASATQTGTVNDSIQELVLGDSNSSGSNQPKIDDVRFYRGVLTAAEVSAIYNNGTGDVGAPKFAISSPGVIRGAKGKSITYNITADAAYGLTGYNASITYSLLNAPSWLSVVSSSGIVTGTPPSAGTYTFVVKAVNTLGSNVKTVTLTVYDYSDWQYALPITTDLSNGTTLTDWNMLVRLSETDSNGTGNRGFRYAQARSNGGDLRFLDQSGSELKYEIAKWNPSGESHVWVNLPALKSDANITMYWGNPNAGLPTYANDGSVWKDYFGVYHLEHTSGSAKDSGPLNNDLTALNTPVLESSGLAGTAYSTTDSANNGFLSNSLSGTNRAKEGTYTVWAKTPADPANNKSWLGLEYDSNNSLGIEFRANDASPPLARMFASGSTILSTPDDNVGTGNWQMLTLRVKDGYASAYIDGVLDGSTAWFHPGKNLLTGASLGRSITASGPNTTVDEATFSTVARSADWLSASFHNQKPNSTYVNFGSLVGPISLNDSTGTEIYGKKDSNITSFTIGFSGSGSFSATGLPPGLSINSATGVISGATSVVGSQNFTITATGTTAGGASVTVSKQYKIVISDPTSFPFRIDLTIASGKVNSALTDFPLLVSLSTSITGFSYNALLDTDSDGIRTGGDLRFYASNGKELSYELADWNTSGTSNIWVKVPTISSTVNTVINAVWGKTGIETTPDYATNDPVWSNGFHGVWHLDAMTNHSLSDSSSNGFHATAFNGAVVGSAQVGRGIMLDGTDDYINLGKGAGNPGSVVGVSFWVKSSGTRERIFSNKVSDSGTSGWEIFGTSSNTRLYFRGSGSSYRYKSGSVTSWSASNWHHINVGFHTDGSLSLQVDGVNKSMSSPVESIISSTQDLLLGGAHHESEKWNGAFDEVRISNVVRSTDWAKAEYDNQKSSGTKLVSYGSITGPRIITSPLSATGIFNSSFSYTLTATDSSNISSRVFYGLPQGLDFNDNGQITGTPTVAGNYQVALVVNYNNDDGSATDSDSLNDKLGSSDPIDSSAILLNLSIASLPPTIDTLAATSVSATRANFEGNVTSSGGLPPEVKIYYGNADGGTTPSSWATVKSIGNKPTGEFAVLIGDLQPNTAYHYRARAFNDGAPTGVWASTSKSFSTIATNKPVAANGALTNATGTTATLAGKLASLGTGGIYQDTQKPNEIAGSNLKLWLDADDANSFQLSGSNITKWYNKAGNGYIFDQKTGDPTRTVVNGKNVVNFDGNDQLWTNDVFLASNFTILSVSRWTGGGNGRLIASKDRNWLFGYHSSGNDRFYFEGWVRRGGSADTNWNLHAATMNSSDQANTWTNFVQTTTNANGAHNSNYAPSKLSFGAFKNLREPSKGEIREILVFDTVLSTADRQKLEGYLAQKWGLTASLPANHPYQLKNGANLTLYWGANDGGEDENSWDNAVSLGKKSSPLAVWFDASDLDADGTIDTNASVDITLWKDKSGNNRHASGGGNAPYLNSTGGPSGKQVIEKRSGEYLNVAGTFFAKEHFVVFRSPPANTTWSTYGGPFGWNGSSHSAARASNYFFWDNQTTFFSNQYPESASKNGTSVTGWNLAPITNWMILRTVVNNNNIGPHSTYQIGRVTSFQCNLDIAEIIAFESELPDDEADKIESYLAHKWGLADQLTSGHPYKDRAAIRSPRDLGVSTDLTGLVKGNTYYYRVKAGKLGGTDWADSTTSFVSESRIEMSSGDLTFYTDPPVAWTASDGSGGNGVLETLSWTDAQSNTVQHKVAKFAFSQINIGDGVRVSLVGSNPIHLDVEQNATILAKLDASGSSDSNSSKLGGGFGGISVNHAAAHPILLGPTPTIPEVPDIKVAA